VNRVSGDAGTRHSVPWVANRTTTGMYYTPVVVRIGQVAGMVSQVSTKVVVYGRF
jgi:hypothetical protein